MKFFQLLKVPTFSEFLKKLLKNYVVAILISGFLAFFIRVFIVEAFKIPFDFMSPALLPGDHIFLNKTAYSSLFSKKNSVPSRSDVVVFNFISDPTKDYLKRVIGLPGDKVEIKDGHLILNGKDSTVLEPDGSYTDQLENQKIKVYWDGVPLEQRKMVEVLVPEGQIFVLGDNRAKGQDSRAWGFLPLSSLKGKATLIWFSIESGKKIRWSRIFKKVE
jgi:signal peptidase I